MVPFPTIDIPPVLPQYSSSDSSSPSSPSPSVSPSPPSLSSLSEDTARTNFRFLLLSLRFRAVFAGVLFRELPGLRALSVDAFPTDALTVAGAFDFLTGEGNLNIWGCFRFRLPVSFGVPASEGSVPDSLAAPERPYNSLSNKFEAKYFVISAC